jgi:uncharacterized protein YxjI
MEDLKSSNAVMVQQQKELVEVVFDFECANKYSIKTPSGGQILFAAEESDFLIRFLLKTRLWCTIQVAGPDGKLAFKCVKPWRLFFPEMSVVDADGRNCGTIKQEFSLVQKIFNVTDAQGQPLYRIVGPFFKPWTFNVHKGETEVGKITKEWSGLGLEMFTDADNFGVVFPQGADEDHKRLLVAATLLIDLQYFEDPGR